MFLSSAVTATDIGRQRPKPQFSVGSDMYAIQRRGSIRIAVHFDSPGYGMKDASGRRSGLDVYVSKLVAQSLFGGNLEDSCSFIDFVDVASSERMNICQSGDVDLVIAAFANTEDRRKRVSFTKSYFGSHLGVVTREGEGDLDMNRSRIAVVDGTTSVDFVRKHHVGSQIVLVPSNGYLLPAVERGEADVGIHAIALLDAELRSNTFKLVRTSAALPFDIWAIGLHRKRHELKQYLDNRLSELTDAGFVSSAARACS